MSTSTVKVVEGTTRTGADDCARMARNQARTTSTKALGNFCRILSPILVATASILQEVNASEESARKRSGQRGARVPKGRHVRTAGSDGCDTTRLANVAGLRVSEELQR